MTIIKRYWAVAAALSLAVLYFLFDRRGRTIDQLKSQIIRDQVANEIRAIAEQADRSGADYVEAKKRYDELRARHPEYFDQRGQGG